MPKSGIYNVNLFIKWNFNAQLNFFSVAKIIKKSISIFKSVLASDNHALQSTSPWVPFNLAFKMFEILAAQDGILMPGSSYYSLHVIWVYAAPRPTSRTRCESNMERRAESNLLPPLTRVPASAKATSRTIVAQSFDIVDLVSHNSLDPQFIFFPSYIIPNKLNPILFALTIGDMFNASTSVDF